MDAFNIVAVEEKITFVKEAEEQIVDFGKLQLADARTPINQLRHVEEE